MHKVRDLHRFDDYMLIANAKRQEGVRVGHPGAAAGTLFLLEGLTRVTSPVMPSHLVPTADD